MKGPQGEKLLEVQAITLCVVKGSESSRLARSLDKTAHTMWNNNRTLTATAADVAVKKIDQDINVCILNSFEKSYYN
jgi:hypothetical protein